MSLHQQLSTVELEISSICRKRGVDPDELDVHLDEFTDDETDELLNLLENKLGLQEKIYVEQGGNLDNLLFLSDRKKQ